MIQILNKRAPSHQNWCEDNYWLHEQDGLIIGAVLDGCSTGTQSHFASTFFKYSLEKAFKENTDYDSPEELLELLAYATRADIARTAEILALTDMNFLSTMTLFYYKPEWKELVVKFFGDGTVFVNGGRYDNDEGNEPDYLGYYAFTSYINFAEYLATRRTLIFTEVDNFAICSDGIDSWANLKNPQVPKSIAVDFLIENPTFSGLKSGLSKKYNIITQTNSRLITDEELSWWEIKDDLTIIRYSNDS